jgi:hypothetical protein
MSTGIIIGRFQVPELTVGHLALLVRAKQEFDKVGVLLGVAPTIDRRNPLDFGTRMEMLRPWTNFVCPIFDCPGGDKEWSQSVDRTINYYTYRGRLAKGDIILVGGRDSFIPHYRGAFRVKQYAHFSDSSGTASRSSLMEWDQPKTADFRRGIIWGVNSVIKDKA